MDPLPRIFIAYARKDADLLEELRLHLRPLERAKRAVIWYDGKLEGGTEWEPAIKENLHAADIILLLVSANAIASDYFYEKEMSDALDRHQAGTARVVPLIVRPCAWQVTPLSKLQALPKDGKPVSSWPDRDEAWDDAVKALLLFIEGRKQQVAERLEAQRRALDPFHDLMLPILGGPFEMGGKESDWEQPIHKVVVKDFQLCKYPVTQAQWRAVMDSDLPHLFFKGCDDCPVEGVRWDDVPVFLQALNEKTKGNYRLPSEAEWEYAARGGKLSKGTEYPGSYDPDEVAWHYGNSGYKTHAVGKKKANELGLHDMSGNVWEWCQDTWHENYQGAPDDGSAWTSGGQEGLRVVRGGSWGDDADGCRSANRFSVDAVDRYSFVGFRLAR